MPGNDGWRQQARNDEEVDTILGAREDMTRLPTSVHETTGRIW